jgi:DNA transposition AAA+ family ATPase
MSSTLEDALDRGQLDETTVRTAFEAAVMADGRPLSQIAPETSIHYTTLSAWRAQKYTGNNDRVTLQVQQWLDTRTARQRTRATLPVAPGFQMTPTASRIFDVLEHAQTLPDMALVTGGAGIGKTSTILAYQKTAANVHVVTAQPCVTTIKVLLDLLCVTIGVPVVAAALHQSMLLQRKLAGSGGLLILDEAQHLGSGLLDQLRQLHDAANIGVVLVGNTTVFTRLGADRREANFAQLFSRIGMRINIDKPRRKDAEVLLDAWGITDKGARDTLTAIALQPGAHRVLTKVLRMAHAIALAAGGSEPTATHIEDAWRQRTQSRGAA